MSVLKVDTINEKTSGNGVYIAGHVIQVVQSSINSTSTTSTSYTSTGLSAAITPKSASSKILVSVKGIGAEDTADSSQVLFRMERNQPSANTIVDAQQNFPYNSNQYGQGFACVEGKRERYPVMCDLLDSPNTTNAITYTLMICVTGGTGRLGRWGQDGNWDVRTHLTLMEIAL